MPGAAQAGGMSSRRRFLAAASASAVAATSGCLDFILGEESQSFAASPATVEESVAQGTGYETLGTTEQTLSKTFEVGDQSRTVEVTNVVAEYHRAVDLSDLGTVEAAVFATFASPQVEILGETLNPIAELSAADIARQVQGQYDDFRIGEQVASATVEALGGPRDLGQFDGRATFSGAGVDVNLHLSNFTHGGDVVLPLGLYPRQLETEMENVFELARGLTH